MEGGRLGERFFVGCDSSKEEEHSPHWFTGPSVSRFLPNPPT